MELATCICTTHTDLPQARYQFFLVDPPADAVDSFSYGPLLWHPDQSGNLSIVLIQGAAYRGRLDYGRWEAFMVPYAQTYTLPMMLPD